VEGLTMPAIANMRVLLSRAPPQAVSIFSGAPTFTAPALAHGVDAPNLTVASPDTGAPQLEE
jgi:hypothetical protein